MLSTHSDWGQVSPGNILLSVVGQDADPLSLAFGLEFFERGGAGACVRLIFPASSPAIHDHLTVLMGATAAASPSH